MATVGDQLTAPEVGWKRYDGSDSNITYNRKWIARADQTSGCYGNTIDGAIQNGTVSFNFTGTKLRIIVLGWNLENWMIENAPIFIDGTNMGIVQVASDTRIPQVLGFDITGLSNKEHSVQIVVPPDSAHSGKNAFPIDAIDIDDTGELKPYSPNLIPVPTNLTATAGDAKVTLSWTTVDGATGYNVKRSTTAGGPYTTIASNVQGTSYVDTTVTNGTTYYYVVTAITADGESGPSNEASATPQTAVIPPTTDNSLLQITMSDSSEREYKLSKAEIDNFINWINGAGRTGDNSYKFDDVIDSSKEYLIFDKIIGFKVISVVK